MVSAARQKLIEKMRKKVQEKEGGGKDPNEFRPPKVEKGKEVNYYFYVLPISGADDEFDYENGAHWKNRRPHTCPRVTLGEDCPLCDLGFELLEATEDKDTRSAIGKKYLPNVKYAMNILFTDDSDNGDHAGKVMWFNAPKTVYNKMRDALMRDDSGDTKKPHAYGDFFNPDDAYVFNLCIKHKKGFNNYEESDFLMTVDRGPIPDKDANLEKREEDLASKFEAPDMKFLDEQVQKALNGEDDDDDDNSGKSSRSSKSEKSSTDESKEEDTSEKSDSKDEEKAEKSEKSEKSEKAEKAEKSEDKEKKESKAEKSDDSDSKSEEEEVDALLAELDEDD